MLPNINTFNSSTINFEVNKKNRESENLNFTSNAE